MPLYKGTTEIASGKLYKGTTEIENVYKGTSMIYQNSISFNSHFLIVGGGGGGSSVRRWDGDDDETAAEQQYSGGGGAGGLRTSYGPTNGGGQPVDSQLSLATGVDYTITVGSGGSAAQAGATSSIGSLMQVGGGYSATFTSTQTIGTVAPVLAHGSGAGGGSGESYGSTYPANSYVSTSGTYGYNGNNGSRGNYPGGGGGAGGIGGSANNGGMSGNGYGAGAALSNSITGSSIGYARGGATNENALATITQPTQPGSGGSGGASENDYVWSPAGYYRPPTAGNDGIVILRFPNTRNYTATGNPTLTTDGSDKILQWTTAGTYTITFT